MLGGLAGLGAMVRKKAPPRHMDNIGQTSKTNSTENLFMLKSTAVTILAAVLVTLLPAVHGNADAAIVIGDRTSTQTLAFSDTSAFSNAFGNGQTIYDISGNAGDSDSIGYTTPHGSTGFSVSTSSGFSVSAPVLTAGSPNDTESFTLSALSTTAGTLNIADQLGVNVAPAGALSSISMGVTGGYNALIGNYNPKGDLLGPGSSFTYTLYIPGNYSTAGIGTGEHDLLSINSNWTITDNFGYNGADTVFSATVDNYNSSTDQINLQYEIFGSPAPVPLPAAAWLMLSGLGGLGALAHRGRRAA